MVNPDKLPIISINRNDEILHGTGGEHAKAYTFMR